MFHIQKKFSTAIVAAIGGTLFAVNYADNIKESSPLFLLKATIQNASDTSAVNTVGLNHKFDTRDMPESISINGFSKRYGALPNQLEIAGVGMRRKNFYVVEVDVYLASLHLAPSILSRLKSTPNSDNIDLVDMILNQNNRNVGSDFDARASVSLRFVRNLASEKVTEAFNDAFKSCDVNDVNIFKTALSEAIGSSGVKTGDEVTFFWLNNGALQVANNGEPGPIVPVPAVIGQQLLSVYLNPLMTVSKELLNSVRDNMS